MAEDPLYISFHLHFGVAIIVFTLNSYLGGLLRDLMSGWGKALVNTKTSVQLKKINKYLQNFWARKHYAFQFLLSRRLHFN